MDEKNLFKLTMKKYNKKNESDNKNNNSFHTNPIIQKLFVDSSNNVKGKFGLKDLFR